MMRDIPESDWRQFKRVRQVLLERFCQRTLDDLAAMLRARQGSAHDQYRRAYELIAKRDKELACAFNDFRRSTAVMQLVIMRGMGLLSDEELRVFSEQTQQTVRGVDSLRHVEPGAAPNGGPAPSRASSERTGGGCR